MTVERTGVAGQAPGPAVLSLSLDSQIVQANRGEPTRGDPVERQRRYAAHLAALHVMVKTGRESPPERIALAPNAWAYATRSRSRYSFALDAYRLGANICGAERVDVISAQDPFATGLVGWALARRYHKPLNIQVHFDVIDSPHWVGERREHRVLNVLGKWLLRRADTVRVGTTRERAKLARLGISADRIFVAPVPVDLGRFVAAAPNADLRRRLGTGPLIVNASRLVPQKDLSTLLRAAAIVAQRRPDARFVIAGDGPLRAELEGLASSLHLNGAVTFLGGVDRIEVPGLLAAADAIAVSSVYEGTSLITVEAAAAGRPVVTTDVAGTADTVRHGETGYVVPVGDPASFAAALLNVIDDTAHAAQMGVAAQQYVQARFGMEPAIAAVVEMWCATAAMGKRSQS